MAADLAEHPQRSHECPDLSAMRPYARGLCGPATDGYGRRPCPARLTSDDGRPLDRLFRACRPLGGVTAAAIRNTYTSTAHTPPGHWPPPAGLETSGFAESSVSP